MEVIILKKCKGYVLVDALMAFLIFTLVICLLYAGYISLLLSYKKSQEQTLERIYQWEENMDIR